MFSMETSFGDWLQSVLDERGWSRADLAREAKIQNSSLSDIFSGRRNVGTDLATAIADALKIPQEEVYVVAGLLRPRKNRNQTVEQIVHVLEDLSVEEQREFLSYVRWQNNQRKKRK